jgi:hypothetical protein
MSYIGNFGFNPIDNKMKYCSLVILRSVGQGEARHRKYKRLKFGGGQA